MKKRSRSRIYIIGAGFAGSSIAQEIRRKDILGDVVAFLDDDQAKIGTRIDDIPVLGPIADVLTIVKTTPADEALIAMPGAARETLRTVFAQLEKAEFAKIRILPNISQIIEGEAHLIQTREIDPQDLLGRNPVQINLRKSLQYLRGKRVLITGAGGSIGSELARQLLSGGAERLYLFGHGENSIYEIDRELRLLQEEGVGEHATIVPVIGELQDIEFVNFITRRLRADVVFHAAAYKHVPLMEANPVAAVQNNVFGTLNLVRAARDSGVRRFVFISTDKVVDPTSIYGASKKIAEEIVLDAASDGREYMVVRFGNVLGSRGSVVPLLRKQILKGGPVTITSPDITRYFMTIPEASSLVLKAGGVGHGGNLYILDMGEPILIRDLAEQMIRFYGFEPGEEIPLEYIGLRPGEKLVESLWAHDETPLETEFPRIRRISRNGRRPDVEEILAALRPVCFFDPAYAEQYRNRRALRETVRRFIPTTPVHDDEPEY